MKFDLLGLVRADFIALADIDGVALEGPDNPIVADGLLAAAMIVLVLVGPIAMPVLRWLGIGSYRFSLALFWRVLHVVVDKIVDAIILAAVLIVMFGHPWIDALGRAIQKLFS